MSLRKIINLATVESDAVGKIASEFYQIEDTNGQAVWACDVDIGNDTGDANESVIRNVPIATNNRDVLYAEIGKPVALKRVGQGKFEIVGLSKHAIGNIHITYVNLRDQFGEITGDEIRGTTYRMLRYEEFILYGGYGAVPYGAMASFDANGTFIKIL